MKKNYVLDTNVLIQSPASLLCFEDNNLILPIACLEELDGLKKDEGEVGSNARACIRFLERLRQTGNLIEGVELENGGFLRVEANHVEVSLPPSFSDSKNDNRILRVCKGIQDRDLPVILVTKDIILRLKAQLMGIEAQDFTNEQSPKLEHQYTGRSQCFTSDEAMSSFKKKGLKPDEAYTYVNNSRQPIQPIIHEFFIIASETNPKKTLL